MITKEEIMKVKDMDDIEELENEKLENYRNKMYNKLLKDEEVKRHLSNVFNVTENKLGNVLMINGSSPLDNFYEEEIR